MKSMTKGKRYAGNEKIVERGRKYTLEEAAGLLKEIKPAGFDETVELVFHLGVDPKQADQMVRGVIVLPHGTGRDVRVVAFAKGDKAEEAKSAGADEVGGEELADKISGGWMEFDTVVAAPDMMKVVSKLGKILGPRGLMPSPKTGGVTFELENVIKEVKAGRIEFRVDKTSNVHLVAGKISFSEDKLRENIAECVRTILRLRPAACKGQYVKSASLSTSMGPGISLDTQQLISSLK